MSVNTTAPTVSITATIPSGLSAGGHTVAVSATDAAGNIGPAANITLTVDAGGPPDHGRHGEPCGQQREPRPEQWQSVGPHHGIRVRRRFRRLAVKAAEGFIDSVGALGTGFPFTAADGSFNAPTEAVRADIPLATINALASGAHTSTSAARTRSGAGAPRQAFRT